MSQKTKVSVSTYDDRDFELYLPSSATGKDLFYEAISNVGIRDNRKYFGLNFIDSDDQEDWLDMDKKILKHKFKGDSLKFKLGFRYYPEDVTGEYYPGDSMEDIALRLLFKQVCHFIDHIQYDKWKEFDNYGFLFCNCNIEFRGLYIKICSTLFLLPPHGHV